MRQIVSIAQITDVCLRIDRLQIGDSILVDMKERPVADQSELPREIPRRGMLTSFETSARTGEKLAEKFRDIA